jgi:polygalacturonase
VSWKLLLITLAAASAAVADPTLPTIPAAQFLVTNYGAKGDGATDNTAAIQRTLAAAAAAGGGSVEFPAGNFLSGPISVGSRINLQLDAGATLLALPYGVYPLGGSAYTNFISITGDNVAITGPGKIDGQGAAWWAAYNANNAIPHRPYLIKLQNCNYVLIQNLTLTNSPMFHLAFGGTNQVTINQVTILAPTDGPNTDAIDPSGSHYLIENCNLSVGDDDVAVKPQSTFCSDLTITGCTIGTGHGISVGGQTNAGLDGLTVTNCTFNGTTNGLRLKADPTEGGPVTNVTYSHLTMTNVQYPIVFYSYYNLNGTPGSASGSNQVTIAKAQQYNATPPTSLALPTIPTWKNITLADVVATRGTAAQGYNTVWGLPSALFANVTFDHVIMSGYAGTEIYNARNVQFLNGTDLGPLLVYNAQVITAQPRPAAVATGKTATMLAQIAPTAASAGAVQSGFQWSLNGQALTDGARPDGSSVSGSQSGLLVIRSARAAEAGSYSVAVTDALDSYTTALVPGGLSATAAPASATLTMSGAADTGRLINLSSRGVSGTGANALMGGFTIRGGTNSSGAQAVLIRGVGPSLAAFGVLNAVADPAVQLTAFPAGTVLAQNDNWGGDATVSAAAARTGAFGFASSASLDAALVTTLAPGSYSAGVTSASSGAGMVELYDASGASGFGQPQLVNLSTRAVVGPGANALVAGVVIGGTTGRTVLIRGIGPTLSGFGVAGTLGDPQLTVYDAKGAVIATNDDWAGDANVAAIAASVGAFPLASASSKDAAVVLTLAPGAYTAILTGAGSGTGAGMVEIYDVP